MRQLCPCSQDTPLFSAVKINESTTSELNLVIIPAYIFAQCSVFLCIPVQKMQVHLFLL
jgi:hypothetical protein